MTLTGGIINALNSTKWLGTEKPLYRFASETWDWASARIAAAATSATVVIGNGGVAASTST